MKTTRNVLAAAALAAALSPAAALAASDTESPAKDISPQLHVIDAHHAKLSFAMERIGRSHGRLDAGLSAGAGRRIRGLKDVGSHGEQRRYTAILRSKNALREGVKYTVRFRIADFDTASRPVTMKPASR